MSLPPRCKPSLYVYEQRAEDKAREGRRRHSTVAARRPAALLGPRPPAPEKKETWASSLLSKEDGSGRGQPRFRLPPQAPTLPWPRGLAEPCRGPAGTGCRKTFVTGLEKVLCVLSPARQKLERPRPGARGPQRPDQEWGICPRGDGHLPHLRACLLFLKLILQGEEVGGRELSQGNRSRMPTP